MTPPYPKAECRLCSHCEAKGKELNVCSVKKIDCSVRADNGPCRHYDRVSE